MFEVIAIAIGLFAVFLAGFGILLFVTRADDDAWFPIAIVGGVLMLVGMFCAYKVGAGNRVAIVPTHPAPATEVGP